MLMNQVRILAGSDLRSIPLAHVQHPSHCTSLRKCISCVWKMMNIVTVQTCVCLDECGVRDLTLRGVVAHCGESALWDASVRHSVTHNQMAQQVNKHKL